MTMLTFHTSQSFPCLGNHMLPTGFHRFTQKAGQHSRVYPHGTNLFVMERYCRKVQVSCIVQLTHCRQDSVLLLSWRGVLLYTFTPFPASGQKVQIYVRWKQFSWSWANNDVLWSTGEYTNSTGNTWILHCSQKHVSGQNWEPRCSVFSFLRKQQSNSQLTSYRTIYAEVYLVNLI